MVAVIAVSIAVHASSEIDSALERASRAASGGGGGGGGAEAKLVEWRVDALAEEEGGVHAVRQLVGRSPIPCIVTCRPAREGGDYEGDEQRRISLFESLATGEIAESPRYIDVELDAYSSSANLRQKVNLAVDHAKQARDVATSLILSSHHFQGRPADLLQRIERMAREPACAVIKIAWTARSLRDNLEVFDLLAERTKPTIALCMGRFGLMSRVLPGKFGGLLTFAGDGPATITAPGQPTVNELVTLYRFDRINPRTRVYGVIGWPVEHSLSPLVHNAGFEAVGHDGVYLPLPIPGGPTEYEHFKATVGAMIDHPRLDFRGASVTIPHKQNLLRFVRERGGRVDALSERIGAANTLIVGSAGGMECTNTDAPAAVESLCAGMGIQPRELKSKCIAILGAGGVARAVAVGLIDHGAHVVVFNRNEDRARVMVEELQSRYAASGVRANLNVGRPADLACGCFHAIINCTPIGMDGGPAPGGNPLEELFDADIPLDENVTVFDTVYAPPTSRGRTPLITEAEARGARTIMGPDMFLRQAAMQFECWTSTPAPRDIFERAMVQHSPT